MKSAKQKIYCYVDETGQDVGSLFYIVTALVSASEQYQLRAQLLKIEENSRVLRGKWHKTKAERNCAYLEEVLQSGVGKGEVYFVRYEKPVHYFTPMVSLLERALKENIKGYYQTIVYIDGIDKKNAKAVTNALRGCKIHVQAVRGVRDESEPLIRLVDRWAGCIRKAYEHSKVERAIYEMAKKQKYLKMV